MGVFMASTVNLLPGILSAALDWRVMKAHVLDRRKGFLAEFEVAE